ncbi:MAG TPA: hypothetical protein VMB34_10380 [Acetobacteraceae bacterium]|nr:hypothetical protein [Acetobacteraceae bacterium]
MRRKETENELEACVPVCDTNDERGAAAQHGQIVKVFRESVTPAQINLVTTLQRYNELGNFASTGSAVGRPFGRANG